MYKLWYRLDEEDSTRIIPIEVTEQDTIPDYARTSKVFWHKISWKSKIYFETQIQKEKSFLLDSLKNID